MKKGTVQAEVRKINCQWKATRQEGKIKLDESQKPYADQRI